MRLVREETGLWPVSSTRSPQCRSPPGRASQAQNGLRTIKATMVATATAS